MLKEIVLTDFNRWKIDINNFKDKNRFKAGANFHKLVFCTNSAFYQNFWKEDRSELTYSIMIYNSIIFSLLKYQA